MFCTVFKNWCVFFFASHTISRNNPHRRSSSVFPHFCALHPTDIRSDEYLELYLPLFSFLMLSSEGILKCSVRPFLWRHLCLFVNVVAVDPQTSFRQLKTNVGFTQTRKPQNVRILRHRSLSFLTQINHRRHREPKCRSISKTIRDQQYDGWWLSIYKRTLYSWQRMEVDLKRIARRPLVRRSTTTATSSLPF